MQKQKLSKRCPFFYNLKVCIFKYDYITKDFFKTVVTAVVNRISACSEF